MSLVLGLYYTIVGIGAGILFYLPQEGRVKMIKRLQGSSLIVVFFSLFLLAGCATIDMSRPPSGKTMRIESKGWGLWFLSHNIASDVVQAESQCENGIAKIETSQSFGSVLGSILTLGLYNSVAITVTCAADDMASAAVDSASVVTVPYGSDYEEIMDAFGQAADKAVASEQPAYVQFKRDSL